ncbi:MULTISPECIES: 4'-phosphopantetheinyl transferase family protein [Clostridium]|uniref:4'-phosphopantetheinyl transferase family protein n=1 Tax=Clostridium TaxID=1485 RepID=UPI000ADE27B5|nr:MULTISPECIES: 4'-phosphopantetheinyl transferase superfamily protein [Clostridium]AXB85804.1 4-phosphopantetheinyl transferase [Clostridium butyricum]MBO1685685.1 4'-phosphopantetheinyl transferase superfamily protein [Clostridium butyricum]MDB2136579.1 4'-phosphopantetheinyl transferase superfamily protein [Clostridium butyricum]MDB2157830.1 4'-phosphopantetheinyl transferase superfamily protein [Clostridium butyricum]MDI9207753.1 4'-phosphopantetheinyl transferase superfamily protein [Clo
METYAIKILDINDEQLNELSLIIDLEKRIKIKKFINKKDKIRTIIGEILIRTIIIKELSIGNERIKFRKNLYDKPYLKDHTEFNFNISHSGDYVVCVIDSKPVGIDIEEIKHIDYKEISKCFFTVREFDYIINQNLNIQLSKFYTIWTLKESYIKCCGQGLSISLNSFSLDIDRYENAKVIINNEPKEHSFRIFDIEPGYKMAVCSLNKEIPNNIININQHNLIKNYCKLASEKGRIH